MSPDDNENMNKVREVIAIVISILIDTNDWYTTLEVQFHIAILNEDHLQILRCEKS